MIEAHPISGEPLGLVGGLRGLAAQDSSGAPPLPRSEARPGGQLVSAFGPRCLACADGWTSVALPCLLPHSCLGVQPRAPLCCPWPLTHCPAAPLLPCGTPGAPPQCSPPVLCFPLPGMLPFTGSSPRSTLLGLLIKSLRVSAARCWAPPHAWPLSPALGPSQEPPDWLPRWLPRAHPTAPAHGPHLSAQSRLGLVCLPADC